MQAVILAGGLGTRLGTLTRDVPKVMLPFGGKPFLYHIIELLNSQGIKDIVMCTGYLGGQVRNSLGNGKMLGLNITYSVETRELLGTGGALKQAQDMLAEYFLVLNGDTFLPIDYRDVEKEYLSLGRKALMVVYNNEVNTGVKNNVTLDSDQMVVRYDKKGGAPGLKYVEAGAIILSKEALESVPETTVISLEDGIYGPLIERKEMAAYVTGQQFYDIGTPEQKKVFKDFIEKGKR